MMKSGKHTAAKEKKWPLVYLIMIWSTILAVIFWTGFLAYLYAPHFYRATTQENTERLFGGVEAQFEADIIFDRKTGVYYLIATREDNIAVTPMYNIDGLPLCVDDANHGFLEEALKDIHTNVTEGTQL